MLYESPETAHTPFIPPLPSPESLSPPVIPPPPPNHNPPAWAQQPRTAGQYPFYPPTPYNTTPFIPPIPSAHSTPAMPQNSYFPPPANLPNVYGATPGNGFSADYTGYPNGNPSPYVPTQPPPGTPWAAPGTGYTSQQPLPPGTGYMYQQPLPGPPPGWGPQLGASVGDALPGVPPSNMYAGHTPWVHPTAPPPAPPQLPDTARANFRWTSSADHIDHFAEGPHYGPVLEPFLVRAVSATISINPLLSPPTDSHEDYLRWNMIFPTSTCYRTTGPKRSWIKGREAPATFPRLSQIPRRQNIGVTCGEVIETLSAYFHGDVAKKEYEGVSTRRRREIWQAYQYNRSTDSNVPGGHLGEQLRRLDWLCSTSRWGGLVRNDEFIKEACGDVLPCTFELKCIPSYPLTPEEASEQQRMARHAENRSRSRPNSRPRSMESRTNSNEGRDSTDTTTEEEESEYD
ncbi:hypothetical protein BD769DRAFT_1713685 [Suillus cothurnatus]|nr:hypothetical protein BD769DRAFT_1713685 [Suillus cothurnatus]